MSQRPLEPSPPFRKVPAMMPVDGQRAGQAEETFPLVGASYAMGVKIPDDFSLVCFNDVFPIALLPPPLTAVKVSGHEMGRVGAELLLNALASKKTNASVGASK